MRFGDSFVSRDDRYSIGIELDSGRPYVSIPVSNGLVDYEEYYAISSQQSEAFRGDTTAALQFVEECRRQEHGDLLIQKSGTNKRYPRMTRTSGRLTHRSGCRA